MNYAEKLDQTKTTYPFERWQAAFQHGLEQYTPENCRATQEIFDDLIAGLIAKGETATEAEKIELFKNAIEATNELNDEVDGLIETGEREDLCELTNNISIAAGLDPADYGDGEGLASEWREW